MDCDLANPDSVRGCAQSFAERSKNLHALINNAGVNGVLQWDELTPDLDSQFVVNFLAAILLQELLHEQLLRTPEARVVNLASTAHHRVTAPFHPCLGGYAIPNFWPRLGDFDFRKLLPPPRELYHPLHAYAFSNLCRILGARELARRRPYPVVCVHPGNSADTSIMQHMPAPLAAMQVCVGIWWDLRPSSPVQASEQGARCQTWCAVAPSAELAPLSGRYLSGELESWRSWAWVGAGHSPSALAQRDDLAKDLIDFAQKLIASGKWRAAGRTASQSMAKRSSRVLMGVCLSAAIVLASAIWQTFRV